MDTTPQHPGKNSIPDLSEHDVVTTLTQFRLLGRGTTYDELACEGNPKQPVPVIGHAVLSEGVLCVVSSGVACMRLHT